MKLSMWILAEWLESYSPRVFVTKGELSISGVRIIKEEIPVFTHEHVYIAAVSEPFDNLQQCGTIILAHGDDHIFVSNSDTETMINEVLAAFDYYAEWESELQKNSLGEDALQNMIRLSDEVFGFPSRIMDIDGRILAISEKFGPDDVDKRWKKIYEARFVQLHSVGTPVITIEGQYLPEWEEEPRRYRTEGSTFCYIAANIMVDDEIVAAFMLEEFARKHSLAQCQIAGVFCTILRSALKIRENNRQYSFLRSKPAILQDLLEEKHPEGDYASKLQFNDATGVHLDIHLLMVIKNSRELTPKIRTRSMLTMIREFKIQNISLEYQDVLVSVISAENEEKFLDALLLTVNPWYYMVGVSLPFEGWENIPLRYKQANFAIAMGNKIAGVYHSKDYAYKHLIATVSEQNSEWEFLHPGVLTLMRYDEKQNTEFARTLYHFIAYERSLVDTARALHIHRNTLVYRIKRIEELLKTDLDDPDERTFIYLSYELLESRPG